VAAALTLPMSAPADDDTAAAAGPVFQVHPIGRVRRDGGRTTIEIEPAYRDAMLGVDELDSIWVLFWFDRNDERARRSILQVHPRANPDNPLRGVFATHAPVRPNLIGMTRVRILSVDGLSIEIDDIDAWDDTPVLDLKP
jgi:tRNA-Thr(GGU) m(6)t(6)A37 methyltransferase TsaA